MVLFHLVCPRCNNESTVVGEDKWKNPRVNCGDCLMNDVEVVEMKVIHVEEEHNSR